MLDTYHNPYNNRELLAKLLYQSQTTEQALDQANVLFDALPDKNPILSTWDKMYSYCSPFTTNAQPVTALTSSTRPSWMNELDREYQAFTNMPTVHVTDFGAIGDGITDSTKAFQQAIGNGRVKVIVPEGIFVTKGIQLPSWTYLVGEGKGITIIKLHNKASKDMRLVTNMHHRRGNRNIYIGNMTLDWNIERLSSDEKTSSGNNQSSCVTLAHVKYGWIKDVEAINPGLHCFDVSSTRYNYEGDGKRARGGSRYIWLDGLNGYGFGDDGITTHHSDYVCISNCHMCDPSGRSHESGFSNSNGIEVDDGSRHVLLLHNSTARCFGGVEVKAHHNSSAASDVVIAGHISLHDNRSYNFRHIGHHVSTDPPSKTAYYIKAVNLVAIEPVRTPLYKNSKQRGMVISAYQNVVVHNFTLLGNPAYDYQNQPIIAVQYRARDIVLSNIYIENFKSASTDLKIFGGLQRADRVTVQHMRSRNSALSAVYVGEAVEDVKLEAINVIRENGKYAVRSYTPIFMKDVYARGYKQHIFVD
ncbi:glycoside hydrolase family 55 protein [Ectobacillus sp. JY-23]|uniref:glycoside hydrolase family 55 protein n=1 Tax=Ectobacillus sp. JY-23 TaxID=2933872 RepID=UPI001FF10F54|nr:glycoside hydrolase family 55 protein [Ectobacillus sp. JY-23]UOY92989.1 glycoside hydrolase family 55 protein [Ectobacillus sp. JY-23]